MLVNDNKIVEVVGIFDSVQEMQSAVSELCDHGFTYEEVSMLASEDTIKSKLGYQFRRVEDLADDPAAPRTRYVSTQSVDNAKDTILGSLVYTGTIAATGAVLASGGAVLSLITAVAMVGSATGMIGALLGAMLSQNYAVYIKEQLTHGGLLIWVRAHNSGREKLAYQILNKHSAHEVHAHELPMEPELEEFRVASLF